MPMKSVIIVDSKLLEQVPPEYLHEIFNQVYEAGVQDGTESMNRGPQYALAHRDGWNAAVAAIQTAIAEHMPKYRERKGGTWLKLNEDLLSVLRERLAERSHNDWMKTKLDQGFHHPNHCPHKETPDVACGKCHKDLKPYAELSDDVKQINLNVADGIIEELLKVARDE